MKTILNLTCRPALLVALAGLLVATQAHADTPPDPYLSSGLGTLKALLRYLQPFWS